MLNMDASDPYPDPDLVTSNKKVIKIQKFWIWCSPNAEQVKLYWNRCKIETQLLQKEN